MRLLCPSCNKLKDESDFYKSINRKDGLQLKCKECVKEYNKKKYLLNQKKALESQKKNYWLNRNKVLKLQRNKYYARGGQPMATNKDCSHYLGVHIAEGLVAKYFKNPVRMPMHNKGYDFICSNGYKIDVKSSVVTKSNQWLFSIKKNKIADYFLCLGFDNRRDLNLLHVWLFPGLIVNNKTGISSITSKISKWSQYEKPIEDIKNCCETLKV